jgi:hypothetical protein
MSYDSKFCKGACKLLNGQCMGLCSTSHEFVTNYWRQTRDKYEMSGIILPFSHSFDPPSEREIINNKRQKFLSTNQKLADNNSEVTKHEYKR